MMSIPDYGSCTFSTYGVACGKETIGSDFCDEHSKSKCSSCGQPATHGCSFCGQFVCGAPLCDDCAYASDKGPSGSWGFLNHIHIKKGAQLPSEVREKEEEEARLLSYESAALGIPGAN